MKVVVASRRGLEGVLDQIRKGREGSEVEYRMIGDLSPEDLKGSELLVVVGEDRDVLQASHKVGEAPVPIFGVNASNEDGFLTEVGVREFQKAFSRIRRKDYWIEEATRLSVMADGKELPPALNEAGIFSTRSATLIEYVLSVDGEVVWRDCSDGLILSTPTGSTAYSMSAGGPMVLHSAGVFVLVSVNSLDVTRRPLVVSSNSNIKISGLSCTHGCEVIIDGILRAKVKEIVEVSKAREPARLIRLPEASKAMEKMAKKVRLAEELLKMPPSAKLILKILEYEGPMSRRDLTKKTMLPDRTTRLALSILVERGLVKRKPLLRDARQKIYYVSKFER